MSTKDEGLTVSPNDSKPLVSSRSESKRLFEKFSSFKDAAAWHTWKKAFDIGSNHRNEVIVKFVNSIKEMAEEKFEKNKHRPLSESSIEAETTICVCKAIVDALNGC